MLHTISWPQYFAAVSLLTAAWYAYVGVTYYRPELWAILQNKPLKDDPPLHRVMGGIEPEQESFEDDELLFGSAEPDEPGPADELLSELTTLTTICNSREEFLSLLQLLLEKYEVYRDDISLEVIKNSLPPLPFELTINDLDLHWP